MTWSISFWLPSFPWNSDLESTRTPSPRLFFYFFRAVDPTPPVIFFPRSTTPLFTPTISPFSPLMKMMLYLEELVLPPLMSAFPDFLLSPGCIRHFPPCVGTLFNLADVALIVLSAGTPDSRLSRLSYFT